MYDVDLTSAVSEIKRLKARIVGLQVPEGLKKRAYQFAEDIEAKSGAEVLVVAEPCFGACDVPSSLIDIVDAIEFLILLHGDSNPMRPARSGYLVVPLDFS